MSMPGRPLAREGRRLLELFSNARAGLAAGCPWRSPAATASDRALRQRRASRRSGIDYAERA
eukprot:14113540-Alexandrium_andersonii.AAC.1